MITLHPPFLRKIVGLALFLITGVSTSLNAQVNFAKSDLDFNGQGNVSSGVTSLMYGPDGRLYVAEYPGTIKILTIDRNGASDYVVTNIEQLSSVTDIVNHDDDGTVNNAETQRETTGITVGGTAANPVIYVTSSDFRIGSGFGGGNGDLDLDTNSGIITRISWNGTSWETVDLVRGLPRSEENHATNGLEFVTVNGVDYLIVASGGITNAGGPGTNFVYTCEYALSGAVLSVNLDLLNAMAIKTDGNGRKYIYDLPTLDDPSRANVNGITDPDNPSYNGIDINDPFGGNDGLNQAMIVPGGPVQIFSPGYRNAYDLVVTQSGAVYVTDNGANVGWGGFPVNEGGGSATNAYDSNEPGSSNPTADGEMVNNVDHLELVTNNIQNYTFGSFYAGHPNPTRANPNGAGLYTAPNLLGTAGAVFRTMVYDPDGSTPGSTTNAAIALPANWPPVTTANSVEGDWRGPGMSNPDGPDDNPITTWGTNTNGIDEYTASNFGGAMQGDLLAGHNNGILRRVELNPNGSLQQLTSNFLTNIGGNALGVSCNSDTEIFPGTIWIGTLNGKIVVFEPGDFESCINPGESGYDANADYDGDGYTNQDEVDNGTDHCSPLSQPNDFDKAVGGTLVSDLNDADDDADGIPDASDPFQLGDPTTAGSDAFVLPVSNNLFDNAQGLGGIYGVGLTGLMNNGAANPNWLNWIDDTGQGPNPDDVIDGVAGLMTLQMTSGTAMGGSNTQEKGFQYGVQVDQNSSSFTVSGKLLNLHGPLRLYDHTAAIGGELGFFIGDGTQSNYIKFVVTTAGLTALQEINDVPQTPVNFPIALPDKPSTDIIFYFEIDPSNGEVELQYAADGASPASIGFINAQAAILNALQQANSDLAVGFIGTSNTPGVELEGTWDYLNVIPSAENFSLRINAGGPEIMHAGKLFSADQLFQGGVPFSNSNAQVPVLFQTERTASPPTFDYEIPVTNGDYTIILHFAEIYWGATGSGPGGIGNRIFDVRIENALVLDNYDINADVGPETTVSKSFDTNITDGELNIHFSALAADGGVNQPKISAIEVIGNSSNAPPVAMASAVPTTGIIPLEVTFTGSNSTDDVAVVSYLWDFKDGSPVSTLANPVHTFTVANTYMVELTVEDGEGLTDTTSITINANDIVNEAPVAIASALPTSGTVPLVVSFTGDGSTDDVAVVSYQWDFKDGSPISTTANPAHTFGVAGTYIVELTVEDGEGLTDSTTITIEVGSPVNEAPQAVMSASPLNGEAPLEVIFTGSNSTDDVAVVSYLWDFGDDSATSSEENPTHTFANAGTYEVTLTVADIEGLTATSSVTIIVVETQAEKEIDKEIDAMLIVNPANEVAQIRLIDNGPADRRVVKIYLHDSSGRLIDLYSPSEVFVHGLFEIPIATLTDGGVYYIGFEMNKGDRLVMSLIVKH
ncbi:PKD domain-containing protein [Muriicola sp. Z0-33]|uniref:PKD domain-containing protein n=1 Tax=Muriicola sp. Z0-33 TaxID=2816957 RepID=UPI002237590D|nr:PKD domain-containing protein [Muriicola sp. Z0-33]MCW5517232.1 PKD domain-containing protein [Muriicola sp. Z0-33]